MAVDDPSPHPERRLTRSSRDGRVNPTTRTGTLVHAPGQDERSGYAGCGWYMRGIWYTTEAVNCPKCTAAQ